MLKRCLILVPVIYVFIVPGCGDEAATKPATSPPAAGAPALDKSTPTKAPAAPAGGSGKAKPAPDNF